jgi:L-lactate utilization protein LutC
LAQSERIAQILNKDLGSATITHPFHPLYGKSFAILKIRKFPSGRFFSLLTENDVFCVPESWIIPNKSDCFENSPFDVEVVQSLLEFVRNHAKVLTKP